MDAHIRGGAWYNPQGEGGSASTSCGDKNTVSTTSPASPPTKIHQLHPPPTAAMQNLADPAFLLPTTPPHACGGKYLSRERAGASVDRLIIEYTNTSLQLIFDAKNKRTHQVGRSSKATAASPGAPSGELVLCRQHRRGAATPGSRRRYRRRDEHVATSMMVHRRKSTSGDVSCWAIAERRRRGRPR